MRSAQRYLKAALAVVLAGGGAVSVPVQAVTLDFSSVLTDGTCTLSLDKSILPLGVIAKSQLRPNQLVAPQPFTLSVQDCTGSAGGSLTHSEKLSRQVEEAETARTGGRPSQRSGKRPACSPPAAPVPASSATSRTPSA